MCNTISLAFYFSKVLDRKVDLDLSQSQQDEQAKVRNAIVDAYTRCLPRVQRKLVFGPDKPPQRAITLTEGMFFVVSDVRLNEARGSVFLTWGGSFEITISHRRSTSISFILHHDFNIRSKFIFSSVSKQQLLP